MIVRFLFIIITFLIAVPSFAQKEDTVPILNKSLERERLWQDFSKLLYQNPALNYYRYTSNLSTISIYGNKDSQYQSVLAEEGEGWKGFKVDAESYIRLSKNSCLWGKAFYNNGIRENVQWNENSDYNKLYPYVVADSIGGNIKSGTYFFRGGYSQQHQRWTFGAEFFYRALMEYRNVDPRPKNTVAELQGNIGISYRLSTFYTIGLRAEANKYKQNSSIKYFNELGVSKTFQLQGLGTSYIRFDGTNTTVDYQGKTFGIGLDLLPTAFEKGAFASFHYNHSTYEKFIPQVNNITLNGIRETLLQGEIGWSKAAEEQQWGAKSWMALKNRFGDEYLYGDATSNQYPHLATNEGYKHKQIDCGLATFYEQSISKTWILGGNLEAGYSSNKHHHYSSQNQLKYNTIHVALTAVSHWNWKRHRLEASIGGSYQKCNDSNIRMNTTTIPSAADPIIRNFEILSSNPISYHLSAKWSERILKNKLIFVECCWAQRKYTDNYNGYSVFANIGISF